MKTTALLLALLLVGCSTAPQARQIPLTIDFEGRRYLALPLPVSGLQVGQIVAFSARGEVIAGKVVADRGQGVFRVEGEGLTLVHSGNYLAQLVPFN
jgi:hypothetical protein